MTDALCPMDPGFMRDFAEGIQVLAQANPDMIMLDDDFRLNPRGYDLGCCCPRHLEAYQRLLGEDIPREEIYRKVMVSGENPYRKAWLQVMGDSVRNFATYLRTALDTVAPHIPMSACACLNTWGEDGFNSIEIAKILAGKNPPFLRTFGAPYHYGGMRIQKGVECTRMQAAWCEDAGIEIFAEGDSHPRP